MLSPCPLYHTVVSRCLMLYLTIQIIGVQKVEKYILNAHSMCSICSFNTVSFFCVLLTSLIFFSITTSLFFLLCINIICANQMWYLFLIVWISHTESVAPVLPSYLWYIEYLFCYHHLIAVIIFSTSSCVPCQRNHSHPETSHYPLFWHIANPSRSKWLTVLVSTM